MEEVADIAHWPAPGQWSRNTPASGPITGGWSEPRSFVRRASGSGTRRTRLWTITTIAGPPRKGDRTRGAIHNTPLATADADVVADLQRHSRAANIRKHSSKLRRHLRHPLREAARSSGHEVLPKASAGSSSGASSSLPKEVPGQMTPLRLGAGPANSGKGSPGDRVSGRARASAGNDSSRVVSRLAARPRTRNSVRTFAPLRAGVPPRVRRTRVDSSDRDDPCAAHDGMSKHWIASSRCVSRISDPTGRAAAAAMSLDMTHRLRSLPVTARD